MGKILFLIYGLALGVLGTKYVQAHQPKQMYRVTCDYKKYGFQWGTEEELFGNDHRGFHCFMGAEVAKVDGFAQAPDRDLFEEESRMEILPPIISQELSK
jgi:hypothetical protein